MISFEKSYAETSPEEEMISSIRHNVEGTTAYQSMPDEMRDVVEERMGTAIKRKIKQYQRRAAPGANVAELVFMDLTSSLEKELFHQRIVREKLPEMRSAILESAACKELIALTPDLKEDPSEGIDRLLDREISKAIENHTHRGEKSSVHLIVAKSIGNVMEEIERELEKQKLLLEFTEPVRDQIRESDVFKKLSLEFPVIDSDLDKTVERELSQLIKNKVPHDTLQQRAVDNILRHLDSRKTSSVDRIVGKMSEMERQRDILSMNGIYGNQEGIYKGEREKTLKEIELLNRANEVTNELLKGMGLEGFDIPFENIHIIKLDAWKEKEKEFIGLHDMQKQSISMVEAPQLSVFFRVAVHELLHMKSYHALQKSTGDQSGIEKYRVGLSVVSRDSKNEYLRRLNEGVTEEQTKRICQAEIKKNEILQEEYQRTEKLRKRYFLTPRSTYRGWLFNNDSYSARHTSKNRVYVYDYSYPLERKGLEILIEKMSKKSGRDKDEIFNLFSKAMMTGQLIELGRLIEGSFGAGTLKKLGLQHTDKQFLKFIKSL